MTLSERNGFCHAKTMSTKKLPFYSERGGYFYCGKSYKVAHNYINMHLLIYTVGGGGILTMDGKKTPLTPGTAVLIDRRKPQRYEADSSHWDFYWIDIHGSCVEAYEKMINDKKPRFCI